MESRSKYKLRGINFHKIIDLYNKFPTFVKNWCEMASEMQATIDRLLGKTNVLVEKYLALERDKVALDEENKQLHEAIRRLKGQVESLKQNNEYLQLARTLTPSRENLDESKAIIAQLVRDVEKCISQLI
jgi:uncharacterized protein YaaN involved in tellurite resistance